MTDLNLLEAPLGSLVGLDERKSKLALALAGLDTNKRIVRIEAFRYEDDEVTNPFEVAAQEANPFLDAAETIVEVDLTPARRRPITWLDELRMRGSQGTELDIHIDRGLIRNEFPEAQVLFIDDPDNDVTTCYILPRREPRLAA